MFSDVQETMKACTHTRAGLPSEVLALSTIPRPTITLPTKVLVKISHCALNPGGSIVMKLLPFIFRGSPAIPEMDFSGTIIKTGSDVPKERDLAPGTHVFGSIPLGQHVRSTSGAMAEYIVVDHTAVVRKPVAASLREAAGLGIAGATALKLIKAAGLTKGDSVLVNGASGGIGHLVLQMCLNEVGPSGKVVAVCSSRNVDWIKKMYAHDVTPTETQENVHTRAPPFQIVDYNLHAPVSAFLATSFGRAKFDAIIDAVGIQEIFESSPAFLAEGKPYVTVGPRAYSYSYLGMLRTIGTMAKNALWPQRFGGTPRPYIQVTSAANLAAMEELAKMVAEGKLKIHVGTTVEMEEIQKAYEQLLSGHTQGKIVVAIEGTNKG